MIPWFPVDWVARGPPATQAPRTCSEASRSFAGGAFGSATMRVAEWNPRPSVSVAIMFQVEGADCPGGPRGSPRGSAKPAPRRKPLVAPAQVGPGGARSYYCSHEIVIATAQLLLQPRSYYCNSEVIIATKKLLLQAPCYYYCVCTQNNQWFSPRTTCNNNRVFAITTGALQ